MLDYLSPFIEYDFRDNGYEGKIYTEPYMLLKETENMNIDGFTLELKDFCAYCGDFEPKVEKIDCTSFGEATRYITNIRCQNRQRCDRIAENLEKRLKENV